MENQSNKNPKYDLTKSTDPLEESIRKYHDAENEGFAFGSTLEAATALALIAIAEELRQLNTRETS